MNKKVFIDCGANLGQSIDNFIKKWVDWREYDILSYEANPSLVPHFERFSSVSNVKFENAAVWMQDGTVDFFLCNQGNASSSLVGTKVTGNLDKKPTTVRSVDIDRVVRQYTKEDYVILKMDIEGAEYELLDYMLNKGTFDLIDVLYIEFHTNKVHKTKRDDEDLLARLKEYEHLEVFHDTYNHYNFI